MMSCRLVCICLLFVGQTYAASPVEKVIELMGSCKAKVESDLAAEGKAMEEFTDFCDNTLKDTDYAIKTATGEIADLKASIEQASAEIDASSSEIEEIGSKLAQKGSEIADAKKVRAAGNADFRANEKELQGTIDEVTRAVVKLKSGASLIQVGDSKKTQNAKLVASLQAEAPVWQKLLEATYIPAQSKKSLAALLQQGTNAAEGDMDDLSLSAPVQGATSNYESHSGGILGTVQDMEEKAQGQLTDLRKAEMEAKFSADMVNRGLEDEVKVLNDKMGSVKAKKSAAAEALGKAKGELASTEKSKAEDEALVTAQTQECKAKAAEWEARQKSAAGEMAAIDKATEILKNGVKVFAQTKAVTRRAKKNGEDQEDTDAEQDKRDQLAGFLQKMSHKYNSFSLSQLAMSASADPFGKVKGMIEDMVEKLLDDQNKEASQKAFCDTETSKTRKSMEDKTMNFDTLSARADEAGTKRAELAQSVKSLQGEVAELDKSMSEATAIRNSENAEFLKASKDFKDSADAVVAAISVLKSYYAGGSFVQVAAKSQSVLKMKQPDFGGDQGDTAHTIIEVLEMSEEDFTRLLAEAETDEQNAAAEFQTLAQDTRVSKASKEAEIGAKESEVKSLTVDLNNHNEDKDAVAKELEAVQAYMDKLKPQCEEKAMSYEEKKARREAEIDGLKEALEIIAGDSIPAASLVQKKQNLRRVQKH